MSVAALTGQCLWLEAKKWPLAQCGNGDGGGPALHQAENFNNHNYKFQSSRVSLPNWEGEWIQINYSKFSLENEVFKLICPTGIFGCSLYENST